MAVERLGLGPDGTSPRVADDVTFVVISHDYGRYLTQAVESVLEQTRVPRVLIMDDASTDETPGIARALVERAPGRLDYHRSETNRGLAGMRNLAVSLVGTAGVVYLDADDWLATDFVEKALDHLAGHPGLDALTTDMTVVRTGRRPFRSRARVPRVWTKLLTANGIPQTSVIRRDVIRALGGYDPTLHFEDWDFWIRLLKARHSIGRLPGAHVFRREHGLNKGKVCDQALGAEQIRARHPLDGG